MSAKGTAAMVTMLQFLAHWSPPSLAGLPIGGWAETQQARLALANAMPSPERRRWTRTDYIDAMYDTSGAHYRVRPDAEKRVRQWDAEHEFVIRGGKAVSA